MSLRVLLALLVLAVMVAETDRVVAVDAVDRLTAERLEAVHQAVLRFKSERRELPRGSALRDYRANLHVHSALSHDSRGTVAEIVAAAAAVGTQVLMFTEHPADHYDVFRDGHQGTREGVLLIPGAESKGLVVFPRQSVRGLDIGTVQEFSNLVRRGGGLTFLSHLEERMDWELDGLTGVEIYNTHADVKDENRLTALLRNPLWLLNIAELAHRYPQESFSALQDYPADYLRRWDQLCEHSAHTGVSANDSHQNIGLAIRLFEGDKARVEDALGDKLLELDATALAKLLPGQKLGEAGSIMFQLRLDPYECSLRHVGTHLLMDALNQEAVWQALRDGRAFVAFDWIADATGFDVAMEISGTRYEMGSSLPLAKDLRLFGHAPLSARWRLIRNGTSVAESTGTTFEAHIDQPGRYRTELWLDLAGEEYIWILSNPFYITGDDASGR